MTHRTDKRLMSGIYKSVRKRDNPKMRKRPELAFPKDKLKI